MLVRYYVWYTQIWQKQALLAHILAQFVKKPVSVHFLLAHPVG